MCLDAGINLIDTADVYSTGRSEEIVGEALEAKRDDVLISTKVRMPMGERRPTRPACRATTSSAAARPACGGCAPTTSTSTTCTSGTA